MDTATTSTGRQGNRTWAGRYARAPETAVAAAALLGLLASVEVILRREGAAGTATLSPGVTAAGGAGMSVALLLCLCATVPLALARTHPVPAAVVTAGAGLLSPVLFQPSTVAGLVALGGCLYVLPGRGPRLLTVLLALPFTAYAIAAPSSPVASAGTGDRLMSVVAAAVSAGAAGMGLARRARREALVHSATERAVADTLLAHAARGERARIARELHDVVAHHLSMISVQAETARLTTAGLPEDGAKRLLAIGDTARAALTEMRRLLGVLREDAGGGADRRPQPGLQQLNELVDEARDASASAIRLIVSGMVRPLDPGVELTAYRLVQEALTNARRHAPRAPIDVELRYRADELVLRVRDNGPGPSPYGRAPRADGGGGHGLVGMRERAATVGGELRTGPAPCGGFLVEAALPVPAGTGSQAGAGNPAGTGSQTGAGGTASAGNPSGAGNPADGARPVSPAGGRRVS
ncbi:sensor histidine kinase [Streptomyces sp. NPDC051018]|uniref:sensor histidine kinase n=1 Tax=Streptomyces sp. NPDC051018 TaxID=3365639 RepID=UPI0037B4FB8D